MEESIISISQLNDFIFCPVSIYFHNLYGNGNIRLYQRKDQVNGTAAHSAVDNGKYSTKKSLLMGMDVYSEEYGLIGKIDIFDNVTGKLTERKKMIHKVYDGFVFQVYAQFVCLSEMGYKVNTLNLYSMDDNKNYPVQLPSDNPDMWEKFCRVIKDIRSFDMNTFIQSNEEKCKGCIYEPICDRSLL